jgi:hypothetical protein
MLSAASFESSGSSPPRSSARFSCPEPASGSGFSLAHNDRPFPSGHNEVTVPDLLLQHLAERSSDPFACGSIADAGLPQRRRSQHRRTVPRFPPGNPSLASDLLPLRGFSFPPDQRSIRFGTGKLVFRNSPISCRSPIIEAIASPRLRIMAPGLLPLRRLAVPQTSWNQLNSPPNPISCQSDANLRKIETQANGPVRHSGSVRTAERLHPLENTPHRVQRHTFGGTRREKWNPS